MSKKIRIDWVNRSHFFTKKELNYINNFLKESKSLTQGKELLKFETSLRSYLKVQNINVRHVIGFLKNL